MKNYDFKDFEKTLIPWIGRNAKFFGLYNQAIFKILGVDINKEQLLILKFLMEKDGLVQNDLAIITEKNKTTLTRLIHRMEDKELVKRKQCKDDSRCNKIYITQKGREKFAKVFPILIENIKKVQANLSEDEILSSIKVLEKLVKNIKELNNEIK